MIILGILLLFIGVALAFLMVLKLLEPTFFLSFLSFASSSGGLILGFIGLSQYISSRR